MANRHDYNLSEKISIDFEGLKFWIMPRYRQHYINESYEQFSLKIMGNYLDPSKTLLDIGAHYGAYSIYAATKTGSKVVAVEPVIENFQLLTENVKSNKLTSKIKTYNVAASDENGEAEFNIPWASDSAGFYEHPLAETVKKQKVKVRKIDDLVADQKIDFIKIDTEGHEVNVLHGLSQTLKKNPQAILLTEANPSTLRAAGQTMDVLLRKLTDDFDKEIYVVDEKQFTLYKLTERLSQWADFISPDGYANLLCVPKKDHKFALYIEHSTELGGAEMALVEQIEYLRKENYIAHVVVPGVGGLQSWLADKGISHSIINYTFWERPSKGDTLADINHLNMEAAATIAQLAERIKPDLIINNTMVCPWGVAAARAQGLPLVWLVHEYGDLDHGIKFLYGIKDIRRFIIQESDLVICFSDSVKRVLTKAKNDKKIHRLYLGLDKTKIKEMAKEKISWPFSQTGSGSLKLIFVGRVKESKGQILAIKALAKLKPKGLMPQLLIVGPGDESYIQKLESEVKKLGLEGQVKFCGYQKNPYPYIMAADVAIVASVNEAFGRTTAEAMILSKTVIGANSGGTSEMIQDGISGLLFDPGDVDDLADKIEMISNTKKATTLGSQAYSKIVKMVDPEQYTNQLLNLFNAIDYTADRSTKAIFVKEWIDALNVDKSERLTLSEQVSQLKKDLVTQVDELQRANAELENRYRQLIKSKSWKITQPLRSGAKIARRNKRKPIDEGNT